MAMLVAAAFLLTGCDGGVGRRNPGNSRQSSAASSALCGSKLGVRRLTVRRTDAFPQNRMRFSFPNQVTVTGVPEVTAAARALCSLPAMPRGTLHCPADFGIVYNLNFYAGKRLIAVVEVDASGCQTVSGLGHERWAARSPGFWRALGRSMKLPSPSYATFRGSGPNG